MESLPSGPTTLDGGDAEVERLKLLVQESRKKLEEARDDIDRLSKRFLEQVSASLRRGRKVLLVQNASHSGCEL